MTQRAMTAFAGVMLLAVLQAAPGIAAGRPVSTPAPTTPIVFPGAKIEHADGSSCTLGFLARVPASQPDQRDRFFGITAGHCVISSPSETNWPTGEGPTVAVRLRTSDELVWQPQTKVIGHYVHAAYLRLDGVDIAVIELDEDVAFDAAVCFFGGPTRVDRHRRTGREILSHVGHGNALNPRKLVGDDFTGDVAYVQGATYFGDSGGPVLSEDGAALGIIHGLSANTVDDDARPRSSGTLVVRLDAMLTRIKQRAGLDLEVLTAPLSSREWPRDAVEDPSCASY